MDALYHETNKLVHEIQEGLGYLERSPTDVDFNRIHGKINDKIELLIGNCERLDILVNKEPPTRRANAKIRVDQLKYDCQHLQSALQNVQHRRYQKQEEERAREALLSRTFTTNDDATSIEIDHALQHNQRLNNANRGIDDMIIGGSNIISNLREQRVTLKGAHKKILDIANTLGLSNTVLRLIERRTYQDKFILYGGMILTCVIMFMVWKYFS